MQEQTLTWSPTHTLKFTLTKTAACSFSAGRRRCASISRALVRRLYRVLKYIERTPENESIIPAYAHPCICERCATATGYGPRFCILMGSYKAALTPGSIYQ